MSKDRVRLPARRPYWLKQGPAIPSLRVRSSGWAASLETRRVARSSQQPYQKWRTHQPIRMCRAVIAVATAHDDGSNPRRNTMELASPESIRALTRGCGNPTRVRLSRGVRDAAQPASKCRTTRCKCGQCLQCLEDARWERIFAEKFADPNYYTRPVTHAASPLTSL